MYYSHRLHGLTRRLGLMSVYTVSILLNTAYLLFSSINNGGRVMRKCEKDFDRKVFSFLYILLDALPLSNLNFRKRKGLLTNRIIVDKRQSCHASYESLEFWVQNGSTS